MFHGQAIENQETKGVQRNDNRANDEKLKKKMCFVWERCRHIYLKKQCYCCH